MQGWCVRGRGRWQSLGCTIKLVPLAFLFIRAPASHWLAAILKRSGWVGDGQLSWRSDLLPVVAELLRTVEAEVPAAPEPSTPFEELPSPVLPMAPPLQWDEKKSECVVCMEQEVRPRHTHDAGAAGGVRAGSSTSPHICVPSQCLDAHPPAPEAQASQQGGRQGRAGQGSMWGLGRRLLSSCARLST